MAVAADLDIILSIDKNDVGCAVCETSFCIIDARNTQDSLRISFELFVPVISEDPMMLTKPIAFCFRLGNRVPSNI